MPITIDDRGHRNVCEIDGGEVEGTPTLTILGDDNRISIGRDVNLYESRIEILGNHNQATLGDSCKLRIVTHFVTDRGVISIGTKTTMIDVLMQLHETRTIRIGEDCAFSGGVWISVSDMHSILDRDTDERINYGQDVVVGDHCWLGARVMLLKGAIVGDGSVVGAGSVVTGTVPEYCVSAGVPARVVRQNTRWERDLIPDLPLERSGTSG